MTEFSYRAYDRDGKVLSGLLRADSQGDLLVKLRNIGLTPFQAETHGGEAAGTARQFLFPRRSRIDSGSRARMARQLATLLKAGVALDRALRLLELQVPAGKIKTFLASAIEGVTGGQPLSKVLAGDHAFLPDEIGLIRAGEQAGSLAAVLEELAALLERRLELQGRLISALVYPVILLVMAAAAVMVIAMVLLPNVMPLFEQSGAEPPLVLRLMLSLVTLAGSHGLLAIAVMLAVPAIVSWIARGPRVRPVLDRLVFRLPVLGSLAGMAESSRICRTLGSLLRNGVALQQALSAMQGVARSAVTRQQLSIVAERVSAGTKLVESLRHVTVLDATALQMVQIGEETNALDTMLLHVAQSQETELAQRIERLMTLLTPLLTVALGILFGGLIMSIMGAILDLNDLAAR